MSEPAQQGATSACPHPEAMGIQWSAPISADGQAVLRARLDACEAPGADHGDRNEPLTHVHSVTRKTSA